MIDLAALASRRDYLNLEKWISDKIRDDPDSFMKSCLDFLTDKINALFAPQQQKNQHAVPMSVDVITTFIRILQNYHTTMSAENLAAFKEIVACAQGGYPRNVPSSAGGMMDGGGDKLLDSNSPTASSFSQDIEEEANSYFVCIYKGEIRIPQMIELLLRFKSSVNPRDVDVFNCMIHSLFDEYKFFPRYPEKELAITSMLFGSLIQHSIVTAASLGNALRYVLDALRQPVGSNLFKFGVQALMQFQTRLMEWPQYCSLISQIPHLVHAHPEIIAYIKNARQSAEAAAVAAGGRGLPVEDPLSSLMSGMMGGGGNQSPNSMLSQSINSGGSSLSSSINGSGGGGYDSGHLFPALNLGLLTSDKDSTSPPNETIQDKILFIINNIVSDNVLQKTAEMVDMYKPSYCRWLCHYIVGKRVTIEPNNHGLYITLLDGLKSKEVERKILEETLISIGTLLNSEKTVKSSEERTLLKNLGMWLGGITLAKDKPIKHKFLSFKVNG